jgi:serine/threonine protein kinase
MYLYTCFFALASATPSQLRESVADRMPQPEGVYPFHALFRETDTSMTLNWLAATHGVYPTELVGPFMGGSPRRYDFTPEGTIVLEYHLLKNVKSNMFSGTIYANLDPVAGMVEYDEEVDDGSAIGSLESGAIYTNLDPVAGMVEYEGELDDGSAIGSLEPTQGYEYGVDAEEESVDGEHDARARPRNGVRSSPEAHTTTSAVATSSSRAPPVALREVVIKYLNDCRDRLLGPHRFVNPIAEEYALMAALNSTGLVPIIHYLSPMANLIDNPPDLVSTRILNEFIEANWDECVAAGSQSRFIVYEKVGPSIREFLGWLKVTQPDRYFKGVMTIGRKVLDMLQQLHSRGIVHGDIHDDHILFKRAVSHINEIDLESDELVFVDFSSAKSIVGAPEQPVKVPKRSQLHPDVLSPWHLMNYRLGRRDDVFRWIEMLARLFSPELSTGMSNLVLRNMEYAGNPPAGSQAYEEMLVRALYHVKMNERFFGYSAALASIGCNTQMGIPADQVKTVQRGLDAIVTEIRGYKTPDVEPRYSAIQAAMDQVVRRIP